MNRDQFIWDAAAVAALRALWAGPHSAAEIGRRMGLSKNAVVGKAHRLGLPPRPSPIHRGIVADRVPRAPTLAERRATAAAIMARLTGAPDA